jgi:hypothetical protein
VFLERHKPYLRLQVHNTDYIIGCRSIQAGGRLPDSDTPLRAGRHDLMTLTIDFESTRADIEARREERLAQRTLTTGDLTASFQAGKIQLTYAGRELTKEVHIYSAALIGNLWNESAALQWGEPRRSPGRLEISGESRRFPYRQHWTIETVENGLSLEIEFEALEPVEIQEYHASIGLSADYDRWETEFESASFPPFDPGQEDWRHANRNYAAGVTARAMSATLPCVTMKVTMDAIPFRMTAINTGFHQHARVLQALRVPEHGLLRFEPGRHRYFSGLITIEPDRG